MRSFLREPLIHFLLIGAALFVIFEIFDDPSGSDSSRIVVSASQIEFLEANFVRTWKRPPSENELKILVDSYVREEILYREALALGLDKDDHIVRRRLNQKMEMMSSDLIQALTPSDEDLASYLADNSERFLVDPQLSFSHVFFDPQKRGLALEDDAGRLLEQLSGAHERADLSSLGDSLLIPPDIELMTIGEISRTFGSAFAQAILDIEPGTWSGPVRSGYGYHLVVVTNKIDGRLPQLAEVRQQVEREWMVERKTKLNQEIMERLRRNYTVEIDWPPADEPGSAGKPLKQSSS